MASFCTLRRPLSSGRPRDATKRVVSGCAGEWKLGTHADDDAIAIKGCGNSPLDILLVGSVRAHLVRTRSSQATVDNGWAETLRWQELGCFQLRQVGGQCVRQFTTWYPIGGKHQQLSIKEEVIVHHDHDDCILLLRNNNDDMATVTWTRF